MRKYTSQTNFPTPLLKIKQRYQVTIPNIIRKKIGLEIGDLLETRIKKSQILLTRKRATDEGLKKSLREAGEGKLIGPFRNAKALINALNEPPLA